LTNWPFKDLTDTVSRNVGNNLPIGDARHPRISKTSTYHRANDGYITVQTI